jgi:hypothetical protein
MTFFDESAFVNCDTMMAVNDQSVTQVDHITKIFYFFLNAFITRSIYILLALKPIVLIQYEFYGLIT